MIDIVMDLCALCAVQLSLGSFCPKRLAFAEAVLAFCTLLFARLGSPGPIAQFAVYLLSSAALIGTQSLRQIFEAAVCLLCAFTCAAGVATLGSGHLVAFAPLGTFLLWVSVRKRRNIKFRWNVELYVELNGAGDRFPALIDTGNRLRDRWSGLPVLIVEADAIPNFVAEADKLDPSEARLLPFGVLGSTGAVRCFRPDRVEFCWTGSTSRPTPACLVAPFPGRIPGSTRALAPPEFADCTSAAHILPISIELKLRRFRHGIFKRAAIHLWSSRPISQRFSMLHWGKRFAAAATHTRRRGHINAQSQFGRHAGSRDDDRAQPPPCGLHRPKI